MSRSDCWESSAEDREYSLTVLSSKSKSSPCSYFMMFNSSVFLETSYLTDLRYSLISVIFLFGNPMRKASVTCSFYLMSSLSLWNLDIKNRKDKYTPQLHLEYVLRLPSWCGTIFLDYIAKI